MSFDLDADDKHFLDTMHLPQKRSESMQTRQAPKTQCKPHPSSSQLATVTDLTPQEAQAVTEPVNPLIADAFALYIKTKNFHWHLSGSHFRDYHLLFDEQAEAILASIDIM